MHTHGETTHHSIAQSYQAAGRSLGTRLQVDLLSKHQKHTPEQTNNQCLSGRISTANSTADMVQKKTHATASTHPHSHSTRTRATVTELTVCDEPLFLQRQSRVNLDLDGISRRAKWVSSLLHRYTPTQSREAVVTVDQAVLPSCCGVVCESAIGKAANKAYSHL